MALYGISYLVRERELQFADLQPRLERGEESRRRSACAEELASISARCCRSSRWRRTRHDISRPAMNAQEAVRWLYFAYLAAVKSQNGGGDVAGAHRVIPRYLH